MAREGGREIVVGGEFGGDDSRVVVSESCVTKVWGDEFAGYVSA